MTLLSSLGALCGVAAFCFLAAACGYSLIRRFEAAADDELEVLLYSVVVGVVLFEAMLAIQELIWTPARVARAPLVLLAASGVLNWQKTVQLVARLWIRGMRCPPREKFLFAAICLVIAFEGLCGVAPLTGSDALHYHFAAPLVMLSEGFHPDFFLPHSFLIGQGHLLILAGLSLGSEKLALGLLFLGGVLAAAAAGCLTRKWAIGVWPWIASLTFLLTPVVFWQITSAGAPDLWMAYFTTAGVLLISRTAGEASPVIALVAGFCAGAVAGGKYTGVFIATTMALALLAQTRSPRRIGLFFAGALGSGIWPYARNWSWTGDPLFPFFGRYFHHMHENSFALAAMRADTGAAGSHGWWQIATMPFFAAFDAAHPGFWQFFGPLCLIFAPVFLYAKDRKRSWWSAVVVWFISSVLIAATSGMARFLLPVFPVALAAAIAGAAYLQSFHWRPARWLTNSSIACFCFLGAGGLLLYGRQAAEASVGVVGREEYLRQRAPDFAKSKFVNASLQGVGSGKALVFFRHLYYLRVPYAYGDPDASWAVDPAQLSTAAVWLDFLHRENIRWVVRAPDYPVPVAAPLRELESAGILQVYSSGSVNDIEGMRLQGVRAEVHVTVLRVAD